MKLKGVNSVLFNRQKQWGLDCEDMHAVLTCSRTFTKGEEIKRYYTKAQAIGE